MTAPEVVGWVVIALVALAVAAAALTGVWLGAAFIWYRATPDHWTFLAPHGGSVAGVHGVSSVCPSPSTCTARTALRGRACRRRQLARRRRRG